MKVYIIAFLGLIGVDVIAQPFTADLTEVIADGSNFVFKRTSVKPVANSSRMDTLITYSQAYDSINMAIQLQQIASSINEQNETWAEIINAYNNSQSSFEKFDTLVQAISDSTIYDLTALTYKDIFVNGETWTITDNTNPLSVVSYDITFSYAGDIKAKQSGGIGQWNIKVQSPALIIIESWLADDVYLFRTNRDVLTYESLGNIMPWTAPTIRKIRVKIK